MKAGLRSWAAASVATGIMFWAAFAGIASGTSSPALSLAFTAAVATSWRG
jgi:hypothetical protein